MYPAATPSWEDEHTQLPIASIDAQDEPYVLPLREYLETHGVDIVSHASLASHPSYHIVSGDIDFVKHIFFRNDSTGGKRLALVIGPTLGNIDPSDYQAKIIFTDPTPLSDKHVMEIFKFFFTSGNFFLDLRKEPYSQIPHKQPTDEKKEELAAILPWKEIDTLPDERMLSEKDRERIGHIMADVFGQTANPQKVKAETKKWKKKIQRQWVGRIFIGLGFIILPVVWYVMSISISTFMLFFSARALAGGNMATVTWQTRMAQYWIQQGKFIINAASVPLTWVGQQEVLRGQERLISFLSDATHAEIEVQSVMGIGQKVAGGLLNQVDVTTTGMTSAADIAELRSFLYSVQNTLGLAQAELSILLKDRTFPFFISFVESRATRVVGELVTIRSSAAYMDELLSLFLQLSGFKEPRSYLVLLQNSMELRPTGGFIGSVAVASFADGRLTNLDVQDVYTFDGQLKGHVDPPVPIRELLGQEHWYLRDSNWDPDFWESAQRAAWFYQKETGNSVDGVFAINVPFVVELLKATGPIDLSDYNDRISADNFYGKSMYYTQNDFFPGSTQKKDFLGTLTHALIAKMTTGKDVNMPKLFHALTKALGGHDVLMMFAQPDLQTLVDHYGWAGRVPSRAGCTGVDTDTCQFDPLIIVEANFGVNKVNYFIERSIDRQVNIDLDGTVREVATVTFKNTSAGQDKGMPYLAYMQFLLPPDSSVAEITLDGAPVSSRDPKKKPSPLPYVERTPVARGNFTLGVAVDVPAGTQKRLTISYSRPALLRFGPSGTIVDVFDQKQPGVSGTAEHTTIRYPFSWTAGVEESGVEGVQSRDFIAKEGQIEYNTILDRDMLTRIRLTK